MLSAVMFLPIWFFACGSYLFVTAANASQIVMLECLTGVCNLATSTRIMGLSEMVGCAFGMFGSYAGVALIAFGMPMPFLLCGLFSLSSVAILSFSLGSRRNEISRCIPCKTTHESMESPACQGTVAAVAKGEIERTISGLRSIIYREDTFISTENQFRVQIEGEEPKHQVDVNDESPLLKEITTPSGQWVSPDSSEARGRRLKRLTAGFEWAFVELDPTDHVYIGAEPMRCSAIRCVSLDESLVRAHAVTGPRSHSADSFPLQSQSCDSRIGSRYLPPM